MKTCPACQSVAFNDAQVCYGCMHPFGKELYDATKDAEGQNCPTEFALMDPVLPVEDECANKLRTQDEEQTPQQHASELIASKPSAPLNASVLELKIPLLVGSELLSSDLSECDAANVEQVADGWEIKIEVRNNAGCSSSTAVSRRSKKKKA